MRLPSCIHFQLVHVKNVIEVVLFTIFFGDDACGLPFSLFSRGWKTLRKNTLTLQPMRYETIISQINLSLLFKRLTQQTKVVF